MALTTDVCCSRTICFIIFLAIRFLDSVPGYYHAKLLCVKC